MTMSNVILLGNCLDKLKELPDNSVDSVVTDPPYGLGIKDPTVDQIVEYLKGEHLDTGGDFMGRKWSIPPVDVWRECHRVLKPGGHLRCFAGTRTYDIMSLAAATMSTPSPLRNEAGDACWRGGVSTACRFWVAPTRRMA